MAARDQIKELKINVTNIKSVLVKGKEQERKITSKKVSFIRKEEQREKRIEKENALENFRLPTFGVAGLVKSTTAGIFGGLMGFLGNILAGYIVKRLPEIIAWAEGVYENNIKPAWESATKTLGTIFNGIKFVFTGVNNFFNPTDAQKNIDDSEKGMKNLDKEMDSDIKFYTNILKSVGFDVSMFEEQDKPEPDLPDPVGAGAPQSQQPTPTSPQMKPQQRNQGGEVLQTRMPKEVPVGDATYKNPGRAFPRVAKKHFANTEAFKKNVGKFGELVKLLKSSNFIAGNRAGGSNSPASLGSGRYSGIYPQTPLMGEGFGTGLKTGPSSKIGGSSEYHIDSQFKSSLSMEQKVKMMDDLAAAYAARGRKIEFSNAAVSGEVWNSKASMKEKMDLLQRAFEAHQIPRGRAVDAGGFNRIDYYIPKIEENRFGASAEGAEILVPTHGASTMHYLSGGNYGAYVNLKDKDGNIIFRTGHGDIRGARDGVVINIPKTNKNLGPLANNQKKSVLLAVQPVVKTETKSVLVPYSLNSSGNSNAEQWDAYQNLYNQFG